jgi:hypothetical protein
LHNSKATHQNNEIKISSAQNVASHRIAQNTKIGQEGHRDDDKGKHKGIQLFQIVFKKL